MVQNLDRNMGAITVIMLGGNCLHFEESSGLRCYPNAGKSMDSISANVYWLVVRKTEISRNLKA